MADLDPLGILGYPDDGMPVRRYEPPPFIQLTPDQLSQLTGYEHALQQTMDRIFGQRLPGVEPGFQTVTDQPSAHDGQCDVVVMWIRCTDASAWRIWIGCPQEHLVEADICEAHMTLIDLETSHNFCRTCRKHNNDRQARILACEEPGPEADERVHVLRRERIEAA